MVLLVQGSHIFAMFYAHSTWNAYHVHDTQYADDLCLITPRAWARGKVINCVVVVSKKIAISQGLGTWATSKHRRRKRGGPGGPWPPRLTHPLLPCAKQKAMNLSILPVCNSLPSLLSQKHASFIAAFLEIDCPLSIVVSSFSRTRYR